MVTLTRMAMRRSAMRTPATMHTTLVMTRSTLSLSTRTDQKSAEYAAEVLQVEAEAFFNRLSLEERKAIECAEVPHVLPTLRTKGSLVWRREAHKQGSLAQHLLRRLLCPRGRRQPSQAKAPPSQERCTLLCLIRCLLLRQPGQGTWRTGASTRKRFRLLPLTRRVAPTLLVYVELEWSESKAQGKGRSSYTDSIDDGG